MTNLNIAKAPVSGVKFILHADDALCHADDALLHADDALLHADDALLHADDALLHADDALLHADDALLHADDALLHGDDALLHGDDALLHDDDALFHGDDAFAILKLKNEIAKIKMKTTIKTAAAILLTFNFMNFTNFITNCLAQTTYIDENFDAGIPGSWTKTVGSCPTFPANWNVTTNGFRGGGSYLDGTEFIIVDSDGAACMTSDIDTIDSPSFDASAATTVLLEFDQYYRQCCSSTGKVDVWDGSAWQNVVTYNTTQGGWGAPNQPSIDVSAYKNANMKVRFRYAHAYAWYWSIDNVKVYAPAAAPIQLLFFKANNNNNRVELNWATASETNNDYFTVEKTISENVTGLNEYNWNIVDIVPGSGNSSKVTNYSTSDKHPYKGISYYRLKQTDFDGKFEYSSTIAVHFSDEWKNDIIIYPNPVKEKTVITFEGMKKQNVYLEITNLLGANIFDKKIFITGDEFLYELPVTEQLSQGTYYLKIVLNDKIHTKRLVVSQ